VVPVAGTRGKESSLLWPGVLVDMGIAGTLDEVVLHQLLGLHQVRAGAPDNLPYDLAFLALAVAGTLLLRRTRQPWPTPPPFGTLRLHADRSAHLRQPEWRSGSASDS
jgi:Predicted membrane protein (DUF2243)